MGLDARALRHRHNPVFDGQGGLVRRGGESAGPLCSRCRSSTTIDTQIILAAPMPILSARHTRFDHAVDKTEENYIARDSRNVRVSK